MTHHGGGKAYAKPEALSRRLRETITLQRENATQDAHGQSVPTWTNVDDSVRAEVRQISGFESTQSGQQIATLSYDVTMRYRSDITVTPQHRFKWGERLLNVTSAIDPDGFKKILICRCLENAG